MFSEHSTYLGIDPTAGQRPFSYAALDGSLGLLALGQGSLEDVLAFAGGQRQAFAAVCAPPRPSQGLMELYEVRERLVPPPRPGRWTDFRLAEYQLRTHRISCYRTSRNAEACPTWMQVGFALYRRLEALGYQAYPAENQALQWLEVYPHASFCTLLGHTPLPKHTLEGRVQRQLILYESKLEIPDPMDIFEEITPHRILQGDLLLDSLYTPGELDALAAAYTAYLAATHAEKTTQLGDAREGLIILPVAELKEHY